MKNPQVVSIAGESPDASVAIWGGYVLDNTTQLPLDPADGYSNLVNIEFFDVTTGAFAVQVVSATIVYNKDSEYWAIMLNTPVGSPINTVLLDRHKYVARVWTGAFGFDMRSFTITEFAVDNGSFEESLMRLPFDIRDVGGTLHTVWYDTDAHIGNTTYAKFKAPVFMNGSGTTPATDASLVTHRGAVVPY